MEKAFVYAFPQPKWISTISCDGKPCGSSCGSNSTVDSGGNCQSGSCGGSTSCDFAGTLALFAEKHRDRVKVKIADYASLNSILSSVDDLNQILEANHEELRVSVDNLELVFSQLGPITAINNILAFVGKTPTEADLIEAIEIASRMEPATA